MWAISWNLRTDELFWLREIAELFTVLIPFYILRWKLGVFSTGETNGNRVGVFFVYFFWFRILNLFPISVELQGNLCFFLRCCSWYQFCCTLSFCFSSSLVCVFVIVSCRNIGVKGMLLIFEFDFPLLQTFNLL